ncbi:hypothetical protein M404DRAFT_1003072 [Pisolithus tinctorius Marx 270]|uniref:Uncharacterized protein n=1 Tax=Pisolithus tinctorius Marx 270 TaxID=870435 RepID=A0A0C3P1K9_PISTI|nr:hypothetical protein M404DRAFT_1003072 [Pisolithus tinctorius Marx 270]
MEQAATLALRILAYPRCWILVDAIFIAPFRPSRAWNDIHVAQCTNARLLEAVCCAKSTPFVDYLLACRCQ